MKIFSERYKGLKTVFSLFLVFAILVSVWIGTHFIRTAEANHLQALEKQAEAYFHTESLSIEKTAQKGDFLAALCAKDDGSWCMCVYDRDPLFKNRWRANGGIPDISSGKMVSWNFGSPKREAVLIFCGVGLSEKICWYTFQNNNIFYTAPIDENSVLDIFLIPDTDNINGYPIPLDKEYQPIQPLDGGSTT